MRNANDSRCDRAPSFAALPETPGGFKGTFLYSAAATTDPKQLGVMYLVTSFAFFMLGGLMALLIRTELAVPGLQFLSNEQYNQLFTMHGTIMLLLYATPIVFGFANYVLPLQIGAPDVAFPRLNALSYWLYLFGALVTVSGFLTPGGAADFGWTGGIPPLTSALHSPGVGGGDLWIMGLALAGVGTILGGGVNMITTVICLRAPGMTMFRMPIFTWNVFITMILVLLAFPILTAALMGLLVDRHLGGHLFDPATGGAILWQHLFWFFGHPEVYIVAIPFFGIVSEIFPVFSRKPIFGYAGLVYATIAISALSAAVWAHHMFATGAVLLPFFSMMSFLIAVPTGGQILQLDRNDVERTIDVRNADAVLDRVSGDFPLRWSLRGGDIGEPAARLPCHRFVLSRSALPLRSLRDDRLRHVRRDLFLVPEDSGTLHERTTRSVAFLDDLRRVSHNLSGATLARRRRYAAPIRRLPALGRIHHAELDLHDRFVRSRGVIVAVRVERVHLVPVRGKS